MAPGLAVVTTARAVARWQVGMGLASWRYLWRTTPVYRREEPTAARDGPPPLPPGHDPEVLQVPERGVGPLFHRRYRIQICGARMDPAGLVARIAENPNRVSPAEVAMFRKIRGAPTGISVGDRFLIRMPGPWDGPVQVVDRTPTSFRFATLPGHLEAGQIDFRVGDKGEHLMFQIESWARDRKSVV